MDAEEEGVEIEAAEVVAGEEVLTAEVQRDKLSDPRKKIFST